MSFDFTTINGLKAEWDSLQPLSHEQAQRLWKKFRLEWNYHSNHIEGNTLTYGETELLLFHDQTSGNHTLREYEEMKAHDVGIAYVRKLAEDPSRILGESDIRDLNKFILKEPFWKMAQTADGNATRKRIVPGDYKTSPNNVLTVTGELFEFAAPSDVPSRMAALVAWLSGCLQEGRQHVVSVAAKLHHDFVLIHPFDDGNDRVARMLVNYLFLRLGYPPIIVPSPEKATYLSVLRRADSGDLEPLVSYLGHRLQSSLVLAIKAGKGESVEEAGDVEKEIALFVRSQEHHREKGLPKSVESIRSVYEAGLKDLLVQAIEKMHVFQRLFLSSHVTCDPQIGSGLTDPIDQFEKQIVGSFPNGFRIRFGFCGYRGESTAPFEVATVLQLLFDAAEYQIFVENDRLIQKRYTEPLLSADRERVVQRMLTVVFDEIKERSIVG